MIEKPDSIETQVLTHEQLVSWIEETARILGYANRFELYKNEDLKESWERYERMYTIQLSVYRGWLDE